MVGEFVAHDFNPQQFGSLNHGSAARPKADPNIRAPKLLNKHLLVALCAERITAITA
jgi:hypothetical protein